MRNPSLFGRKFCRMTGSMHFYRDFFSVLNENQKYVKQIFFARFSFIFREENSTLLEL